MGFMSWLSLASVESGVVLSQKPGYEKKVSVFMPQAYEMPRSMRETVPVPPNEIEVQALWFEQLYQPVLATDDGRKVTIVQPGFWNHGGGPDFIRAVARFGGKEG